MQITAAQRLQLKQGQQQSDMPHDYELRQRAKTKQRSAEQRGEGEGEGDAYMRTGAPSWTRNFQQTGQPTVARHGCQASPGPSTCSAAQTPTGTGLRTRLSIFESLGSDALRPHVATAGTHATLTHAGNAILSASNFMILAHAFQAADI